MRPREIALSSISFPLTLKAMISGQLRDNRVINVQWATTVSRGESHGWPSNARNGWTVTSASWCRFIESPPACGRKIRAATWTASTGTVPMPEFIEPWTYREWPWWRLYWRSARCVASTWTNWRGCWRRGRAIAAIGPRYHGSTICIDFSIRTWITTRRSSCTFVYMYIYLDKLVTLLAWTLVARQFCQ